MEKLQVLPVGKFEVVLDEIASRVLAVDVCRERGWIFGAFRRWVDLDAGRSEAYRGALRIAADAKFQECGGIVDGVVAEAAEVAKARLRTAWRIRAAEVWDRVGYGRTVRHEVGLSADYAERLRRARERVIEGEVVSVALPVDPVLGEGGRAADLDDEEVYL